MRVKRGDLLFFKDTPNNPPQTDIYLALTGSGYGHGESFFALRLTDGCTLRLWDTGRFQWVRLTHYDLPAVV